MSRRVLTCSSILLFLFAFLLPLVSLAVGWYGWDARTGAVAGLVTFVALFLASGILLLFVKSPSWLTVTLPLLFGYLYVILPNLILGPFDDAFGALAGAAFTCLLWRRKQPQVSPWVFLPLILSGLYPLVGGFIPGPLDEMTVFLVALTITMVIVWRKMKRSP